MMNFRSRTTYIPLSDNNAPRRKPTIWSLIAVSMVSPMGLSIIIPSMPGLQNVFAAEYSSVQFTLSLYLAATAVAQPVIGLLSDRYGRRPVLLIGLAIFVLSSMAAPAATNIETVIVLRVLQGAGGCAGIVLGRAIIRDLYDRRQAASVIGYVTMAFAVAPMVSPFVGGVLQGQFGWTSIYWFLAFFSFLCLVLAWFDVTETNLAPSSRLGVAQMFRDFATLLADRAFLLYAAIAAISSATFFSFLGGAAFVSEEILRLTPTVYGAWFALTAIGYSTGNFLSGRYAQRFGVYRMILYGSVLLCIPVTLLFLFFGSGIANAASFFIPMFFMGLANGICLPSAIAGAISVRPQIAGAASGLSGSMQTGCGAAFAAMTGALLTGGLSATPLFVVMATTAIVTLILAIVLARWRL